MRRRGEREGRRDRHTTTINNQTTNINTVVVIVIAKPTNIVTDQSSLARMPSTMLLACGDVTPL